MTKISELTTASALAGTELVPIVQSNTTKKVTAAELSGTFTLSKGGNGTNLLPTFSFTNDPDTGMYRAGPNQLGFSTSGTLAWSIDPSGHLISSATGAVLKVTGNSEAGPCYTFVSDTDTGMFNPSPNVVGLAAAGTTIVQASGASTGSVQAVNGTAALPAWSFFNDPDTGIYRLGANVLGFSTGGAVRLTIDGNGRLASAASGDILTNKLILVDGVTAPSADIGFAHIYIDQADGDLKIKFGDGTVKTIVVDT